ncbi:hypothetical protein [Nocardia sp. XZ_19_369]|uniref:hypothetical protein n=1 Tax=Nocardia sp. XZ_19_369 TaxID=2769487 RepID=UPI00188FD438|nr:hypothetical protein [Nocardia sp. XZ_19_369]
MAGPDPIAEIIRLAGLDGLYYGVNEPWNVDDLATRATASVAKYLADPVAPLSETDKVMPEAAPGVFALAIVSGARRLAMVVDAVELAAAAAARENGVSVRQLARAADIAERSAATRYRRKEE